MDETNDTVDLEIIVRGAPEGHKQELRLWLRLLSTTNLVGQEIRRRLRAHFGMTLPQFDLMSQLDRERQGLRLGELSKRMMVTNGNVTGLVDRLEADGLISRESADGDRRVTVARLTARGREAFAAMARAHEAWLAEMMAEVAPDQIDAALRELGALKASVTGHLTGQGDD